MEAHLNRGTYQMENQSNSPHNLPFPLLKILVSNHKTQTLKNHRNKYMEEKFHREKKTIELIETLVECIEFSSKLCANGKIFYCGISLPYIYFYVKNQ